MFQIAIPVIHVTSSIAAEDFYCKGLGFICQSSWRPDETRSDPCYMNLIRDGGRLHVTSFRDGVVGAEQVYVFVDDVDALHTELVAKGVPIAAAPVDQTWGTREMSVRDADRNVVRFGQALQATEPST